MAKEPTKTEAAADGAPAPKKGGKKLIILIVLLVLILGIAGGAAFMLLGHKKHAEGAEDEEEHAEPEPPKVKVDPSKPPVFVQLDQFTVNLASDGSGDHFLQASIVLRVADPKVDAQLKLYMPELKHRILMLLSSKTASELASTEGREELADQLKEESNDILGYPPNPKKNAKRHRPEDDGPVLSVLFNQFIVQ